MRPLVLTLVLALPALAEGWRSLDDTAITTALAARVLQFADGTTQNFFQDGRTLREGADGARWGRWWVEGGRVCLVWPPSADADCQAVELLRIDLRFTAADGQVRLARYVDL